MSEDLVVAAACTLLLQQFLARDSMCLARYMLSPVRLSVCLSVCPSHGWIRQKRLKLGLWIYTVR